MPFLRKDDSACPEFHEELKSEKATNKKVFDVLEQTPTRINDKVSDKKEHCSDYIINTLKQANRALIYQDFGSTFKYGTLRNTIRKLVNNEDVLKLPKECPARFILPKWAHRQEYSCIQRNDKKGMAVDSTFCHIWRG